MSFPNRRWCIVQSNEITSLSVDFSQLITTSNDTARRSVDKNFVLLKYNGNQPSFLNGKTEYTYSGIKTVLQGNDWKMVDETS